MSVRNRHEQIFQVPPVLHHCGWVCRAMQHRQQTKANRICWSWTNRSSQCHSFIHHWWIWAAQMELLSKISSQMPVKTALHSLICCQAACGPKCHVNDDNAQPVPNTSPCGASYWLPLHSWKKTNWQDTSKDHHGAASRTKSLGGQPWAQDTPSTAGDPSWNLQLCSRRAGSDLPNTAHRDCPADQRLGHMVAGMEATWTKLKPFLNLCWG